MCACNVLIYATLRILLYYLSVSYVYTIKPRHRTVVRPSCVKMALICKNGVKVRVRVRVRDRIRVRVRVRSGLGLGLAFHRCTDKGHIFTDKG